LILDNIDKQIVKLLVLFIGITLRKYIDTDSHEIKLDKVLYIFYVIIDIHGPETGIIN